MPAFQAESGMPYWIELASSDLERSAAFYSTLLGWEVEEFEPGYRIARLQGLPVAGMFSKSAEAKVGDTWVTHFLSDDLDATAAAVVAHGGQVLGAPSEVRLGTMTYATDAAGAMFGLVQPAGEESFIAAGEPGTPVWHQLSCTKAYPEAVHFYEQVLQWATMERAEGLYTLALAGGAPFAGVSNLSGVAPAEAASFWQSFLGVADVALAVQTTQAEGGRVLEGPAETEFGLLATLEDPTGAVLTICEVGPPVEEGSESDPLEGLDLEQFGFEGR